MSSEEIRTNETLTGRIFKVPQTLTLTSEGRLQVPPGTSFDFSRADFMSLPGTLRTEIRDDVIAQVSGNYLDGNLVHQNTSSTATDAVSSLVLGSDTCNITGNVGLNDATYDGVLTSTDSYINGSVGNSLISSSNLCYISNAAAPLSSTLEIASSDSCSIINGGTASWPATVSIRDSALCTITSSGTRQTGRSSIIGSTNSSMDSVAHCMIAASDQTVISSTSNIIADSGVFGCQLCNITGRTNQSVIIGSGTNCSIINVPSAVATNNQCIIGSSSSTITRNGAGGTGQSLISACRACSLTAGVSGLGRCLITACEDCSLNTVLGITLRSAIQASNLSTIDSTTNSVIIASNGASMTGPSTANSLLVAAGASIITNPSTNVLLGGQTVSSSNGFSNCFCWSASPTASNQAVFGVNTRVTGSGNDLLIEGGYVNPARGVVTPVRSSSVTTTLSIGDQTLLLSGTANLTLPLASTFGANYPLDTIISFKVLRTASGSVGTISTTAPDLINNLTGFTSYANPSQRTVNFSLVNTTTSPHWRIDSPIPALGIVHSTIDNTFGGTAKSDANQLPTSTSQLTHQALGSTSYYYFDGFSYGNTLSPFYTIANPPTVTTGLVVNITGAYRIKYGFIIKTVSGGGNYLIRSDILAGGLNVDGSYGEHGGTNTVPGTQTVIVESFVVGLPAGSTVTLRISQDSANLINATADIQKAWLEVTTFI